MKILVLLGGDSPEREVSLRSGAAVAKALRQSGHQVVTYDPLEGLDKLAHYQGKIDCVMPILHGRGGEDGVVQEKLEELGLKFLGAGAESSRLCFDKVKTKEILNKLSILTPQWEVVDKNSFSKSQIAKQPFVLKPIDNGSTIDAFIVRNPSRFKLNKSTFVKYPKMLLEELTDGTEITVPVLSGRALPVIEIVPPAGQEFDYENKYNGATAELCPPRSVSQVLQFKAQQLAEKIHRACGVCHLSRTDMIIDKTQQIWVLEINTMPGMTAQSLYPKSAVVAGISMPELVSRFAKMATNA